MNTGQVDRSIIDRMHTRRPWRFLTKALVFRGSTGCLLDLPGGADREGAAAGGGEGELFAVRPIKEI